MSGRTNSRHVRRWSEIVEIWLKLRLSSHQGIDLCHTIYVMNTDGEVCREKTRRRRKCSQTIIYLSMEGHGRIECRSAWPSCHPIWCNKSHKWNTVLPTDIFFEVAESSIPFSQKRKQFCVGWESLPIQRIRW